MLAFFVSAIVLLLLDQCSKLVAQTHAGDKLIPCGPLLRLRISSNSKIIFRQKYARAPLVLLWLAALLSAILLHRHGDWFQTRTTLICLGLAFGGAAGNLLDILRRRCVIDFIHFHRWPVFNLADIAIFAGLAAALWRRY